MGINYDDVVDESRVKQERKPMKIFDDAPIVPDDDDVPLDAPLVPDVAAVAGDDNNGFVVDADGHIVVVQQPPPAKKHKTKITSHGMTTFVPPPPVSGLQQLPYDDFANLLEV